MMPQREDWVRGALRRLPPRVPPPALEDALRVVAARELDRRRRPRPTLAQVWNAWISRVGFSITQLMRPLALPFAGGVTSALMLFSALIPNYPMRANAEYDVPTVLTTGVTVKGLAPIGVPGGEVVVDVFVDLQGRLIDYAIVSPHSALHNHALRRAIENNLLFATFTPATAFGQPISGRVRVSFRSSRIDVRG